MACHMELLPIYAGTQRYLGHVYVEYAIALDVFMYSYPHFYSSSICNSNWYSNWFLGQTELSHFMILKFFFYMYASV